MIGKDEAPVTINTSFRNLVMVKAKLNNKNTLCLFDSGASASIIPPNYVDRNMIRPLSINLNGITGQGVCQGQVTLPFSFHEDPEVYLFTFLVFPHPRPIIGNDNLVKLKIRIDYPLKAIIYKQLHIPFYLHSEELNVINTSKVHT